MTGNGMSRRSFLTLGTVAVAGLAGGALAGCGSAATSGRAVAEDAAAVSSPSFLVAPEPIAEADIAETKDYDVVVVGAGASGIAAALSAKKAGADVCVVQKESKAVSQGSSCLGIDLDKSDEEAIQNYVTKIVAENEYRSKRGLVNMWAHRSGEAVRYILEYGAAGDVPPIVDSEKEIPIEGTDFKLSTVVIRPGIKPIMWQEGVESLAALAEKDGIDFYYSTPGEQLVQDESGAVVGIVCKGKDGYIKFNAKGVVLATGDYQNDEEMVKAYCPDLIGFDNKQFNKTGDGHKMALWVGAQMEPVGHTKMVHDMDSGPMALANAPYLIVDLDGNRFCDESNSGMMFINNLMRGAAHPGHYCQVFDANYVEQAKAWGGKVPSPDELKVYMPEEDADRTGVIESLLDTHKADTLEELAELLQITDVDSFKMSIERYNELVAAGSDGDFGKEPKYLAPIDTPPFYGTHRHVRVSAILGGVNVDETLHVLDAENNQIPGLFAAGNTAGGFYGAVDYPSGIAGLSVGRAVTFGYVAGENAAKEG